MIAARVATALSPQRRGEGGQRPGEGRNLPSRASVAPHPNPLPAKRGEGENHFDEVTLIDSPFSNAANIARALRSVGAALEITSDPIAAANAKKLVLPGVGSFAAARGWLERTRIDAAIHEAVARGASLLGICVGHQLLFDVSHEMGTTRGLGLLRGEVQTFDGPLPVPQIGWNRVSARGALFDGIAPGTPFYFVNSYAVRGAEDEIATADYNGAFTAAASRGRVCGLQFHPEKSSAAGLRVLRNWIACN